MIEVTDLFKEMAQKYYRNVDFKIVSNDDESTIYSGDVILECQINRSVGSSGIQIGNAISDRLQFTLKSTDKIKSGTRLTPYVRYKGEENTEWLRLGRFYCTESKMSNGILTVTAYDRLYNFDKRCAFGGRDSIQALSFPATHQQMWDYVCALRGVESDFQCADFTVSERPLANPNAEDDSKYYTQRQIIGMIAACNAGNAVIDSNGKLTVRRFANRTYTLNKNRCFTQEIDTAEQFQVKGVLFHVDSENDIFIDDDASEYSEDREGIIVCDNALATVGVAEYVWNKLGNLKYSGCEITRRGVGWLDTGETLQVEDFYDAEGGAVNVITSEIDYKFSYDNGFTETIRSVAETAEQSGNRAVVSETNNTTTASTTDKFSSFTANSDGTYTYNGTTYGFETGDDTGYITRVYDDRGNGVNIDTTNAAVNSGKVDFNTAVLTLAMANKLGVHQSTDLILYDNGNEHSEITGGWELNIVTGGNYFAECVTADKSNNSLYGKITPTGTSGIKVMGNVSFSTNYIISLAGYSKVCAQGEWYLALASSGNRNCNLQLTLFKNKPTASTPATPVTGYRRMTDDDELGSVRNTIYEFDVSGLNESHYVSVNVWGTTIASYGNAATNGYFKVTKIWLEK